MENELKTNAVKLSPESQYQIRKSIVRLLKQGKRNKDNMDSNKLIDFMRRLVHDSDKKVFLILDNLRVHHSKKVREWLEKHEKEIEVFFLPPYAPEYNPDKLVNSDLKRSVGKRASVLSKEELEHNVRSHLKILQLNPNKVASFFQAPYTCYAS